MATTSAAPMRPNGVRSDVKRHHIPHLASTLASAFEDDPLLHYLYGPNVGNVYENNEAFFSALLRSELRRVPQHTTIHASQDDGCVAIWNHVGHWDHAESLDFIAAACRIFGTRVVHVANTMKKLKQKHPTEAHMFLSVLGTRKQQQGKGNGSRVISQMLRQCDRDGVAVYLESSNKNNIPFYEKHRFQVVGDISGLPRDCPPVAALWRNPCAQL
ncbi:unnamed protein product [Agarophyton chilense]|eukprot:gb/GEZJ01005488.1/.p1 GENE.gb/GEZJ01005488.1/~~gb/GEZJ01005488.1/.p1  ORF type:complete len:215 (+),score=37.67 gb/GEZJ01005488.1/:303-947(+)